MSTIRQDFQFNVTTCEITFADVQHDEVAPSGQLVLNTCGNTAITINNLSEDEADIDGYYWEFNVDGATVTANTRDFTFAFPWHGCL
ncbi:MAG: hypothetical protein R2795_16625 [Saprospiraceae bacterium]